VKLPYLENAVVAEAKITKYLLNTEHEGGGKEKAAFFTRFGFSVAKWEVMRVALINHAHLHDVSSTLETPEGIHYVIEGELDTPDERQPQIRTIWAIDTDSTTPRLITAYPAK
jgi:hypothetical protein